MTGGMQLVFHAGWSAPLVLLALVAAVGVCLLLNRPTRRSLGRLALALLGTEAACVTLLVLWMVNPRLRYEARTGGEREVAVAIDRSLSMRTPDAPGGQTRYAAARDLAFAADRALLRQLGEKVGRVRLHAFGTRLTAQAPGDFPPQVDPGGYGSNLAGAIEALGAQARAQKLQAIVLLSDGVHTERGDPVAAARQAGVPVYTVGLGQAEGGGGAWRNVAVEEVNVPTRATVGQELEVKVVLRQEGFSGARVPLEARLDGRVVASQEVGLGRPGRQEVRLKFTPPRKGTLILTLGAAHQEGDALKEDDAQQVTVLATDARLKVLYVEGSLRWIYKFLRRVLEREQTIQADCVICTGGGRLMQQGERGLNLKGALPADLAAMQKYDAIVLGDFPRALLDDAGLKLLEQYVKEKKGGLMVLGGPLLLGAGDFAGSPLEAMLPAWLHPPGVPASPAEGATPTLTALGRGASVLKGLEDYFPKLALRRVHGVRGPKPGAEVWLEAGGRPLLLAERYGEGRTMLLTSDDLWSGALRESGRVESSPSGRFWIQALLWLARREGRGREDDPLLMARCDKSYYAPGETVLIQAQLRTPNQSGDPWGSVRGEVRAADASLATLELPAPDAQGRTTLEWKPPQEGAFTVELQARQGNDKAEVDCRFTMGRPFRELERTGLDEDLLREIARASGGAYFTPQGAGGIAEAMLLGQARTARIVEKELLDSPMFFLVFLALATAGWLVRRARSLV